MRCPQDHEVPDGSTFCPICGMQTASRGTLNNEPQGDTAAPWREPVPPTKRRGPLLWILVGVGALVVILAVVGITTKGFGLVKKTKTLTITLNVYTGIGEGCSLPLGYRDVPGLDFTLTVDGGMSYFGSLGAYGDPSDIGASCAFTGYIPNVPEDGSVYRLSSGRGTSTSTHSELVSTGWEWGLTLGY